jgi:hypothetical protein
MIRHKSCNLFIWLIPFIILIFSGTGCSRFLKGEPLLGSGGSLFGSSKSKKEKVIRANRLELVDQDGNVRAQLSMKDDGDPEFIYMDKYGNHRVVMSLQKGRPVIRFTDDDDEIIWSAP